MQSTREVSKLETISKYKFKYKQIKLFVKLHAKLTLTF